MRLSSVAASALTVVAAALLVPAQAVPARVPIKPGTVKIWPVVLPDCDSALGPGVPAGSLNPPHVKPTTHTLTCADGNADVGKLRWLNWGGWFAVARGVVAQNDCKPYCAAGHWHSTPAIVVAFRLRPCKNWLARGYTRLEIAPIGTPANGFSWTFRTFTTAC